MKKRLFGIITILGIGLSFCSADEWIVDKPNLGQWNDSFLLSGLYNQFYFNTNYSYISVDSLCFTFRDSINPSSLYIVVGLGDGNYYHSDSYNLISTGQSSSQFGCYNFSNPLIVSNNQIVYFGVSFNSNFTDFTVDSSIRRGWFFIYRIPNSVYNSYLSGDFVDVAFNGSLYIGTQLGNWYSPTFLIYGVKYSEVQLSPKFKVNYGNTSYEYELSDNLEIHLKSPVNMSGSYNYIYDGSTGINLFYNNTSDFYSKDKLYLKSMYWYNKNIFTPICL